MIGYKGYYVPKGGGKGVRVLVVADNGDTLVVWKILFGVILEREVRPETVFVERGVYD